MKAPIYAAGLVALAASPLAAAQSACPANDPASAVEVPGFSCTLGDKTFSNFTLSGVPGTALVQFGTLGPLFAVTLNRDGTFFPVGTTVFDYTITATPGLHILEGTVGVDVSFPPEVTVTTMNGQTASIANGGTAQFMFPANTGSVAVTNTSHVLTATTDLNSISNDFSQIVIGVAEPNTFPLAALGLGGLMFVWRRRRGD